MTADPVDTGHLVDSLKLLTSIRHVHGVSSILKTHKDVKVMLDTFSCLAVTVECPLKFAASVCVDSSALQSERMKEKSFYPRQICG